MRVGLAKPGQAKATTKRHAVTYSYARKPVEWRSPTKVREVTGRSRYNARPRLRAKALAPPAKRGAPGPAQGRRRYCYDGLKVLRRVRAASGGQSAKYLAVPLDRLLGNFEARGRLGGRRFPLLSPGMRRAGADERSEYRPLAAAGQGQRPTSRHLGDQAGEDAVQLDHDPRGVRQGGGGTGVLRRRHRRLLPDPPSKASSREA
jgi:hypothetical protein